jgi:hypothetical protein
MFHHDPPHCFEVPGGWIFFGGPLPGAVLVSDPAKWAPDATVISEVNRKVDKIMATVADVEAALASNETKQDTIIGLLKTEAADLKDTREQLAAAIAAGADPAALQNVVDKMTADGKRMDDAIAAVSAPPVDTTPTPPVDTTPPEPTPAPEPAA